MRGEGDSEGREGRRILMKVGGENGGGLEECQRLK